MAGDTTFRDVVTYAIGGGWGQETPFADSLAVAVIRGTDFASVAVGSYDAVPRRYEDTSKAQRRLLRPGDIVLEISGGSRTSNQFTGRTLLVTPVMLERLGASVIPASFCRLVRFNEELVYPPYGYYVLQEMYRSGRASLYEHHSTGISNFQFEYFLDQELIPLPPLSEQHAIAHILGGLDDTIMMNRRLNETLEEIARALFKSWFVDFDPVRAKAEGRDPGLPSEIVDLFPDSFEESELGEIPKGWEVRGLDEIARFLNGLALQKYPPRDGESLPVIKIAQLRAGDTRGADRANLDVPPEYVVGDGDVLFSWSGSLTAVLWAGGKGALNQHLFKVTSAEFPDWFFYLWTLEHLPGFRRIAAAKATTMGHIQRHHLTEAKVLVPPHEFLSAADQYIGSLLESAPKRLVQSRTLGQLRNDLLPKLVSGDLRIANPASLLEGA